MLCITMIYTPHTYVWYSNMFVYYKNIIVIIYITMYHVLSEELFM